MFNLGFTPKIRSITLHYDILQQICAEIPLKKDLFSFSLACKSHLDPVMDKIWADLPSFVLLVMTMPKDLLSITAAQPVASPQNQYAGPARTIDCLSFIRPASGSDWDRFSWYARRVKAITQQPFLHPKTRKRLHIDSSIWEGYAKHTSQTLFPQLRSITFDWRFDELGADILPCLGVILRPEITKVGFFAPPQPSLSTTSNDDIFPLLKTVANLCPRIESFDCDMLGSCTPGYSISQFVETLYNLRDLTINSALSHSTYIHLGNLSHLRSLSLFLGEGRMDNIPSSLPTDTFPRLQSLSLRAPRWDLIERMLSLIPTQLCAIQLSTLFFPGTGVALSRVVLLQAHLVHLSLELGDPYQGHMQQHNLSIDILAPLKNLAQLKSLKLKCNGVAGFVTPFLVQKPCPLPHLRQLKLISTGGYRSAPFKLIEMTNLFEDYLLLQELNVPIILEPFPLEGVVPAGNIVSVLSTSGLKCPRRYHTKCDAVFLSAVVHCLSRCFPLLEKIDGERFGTTHEEKVATMERLNIREFL